MAKKRQNGTRNLILVLGDQLNADSPAFDQFDAKLDAVWMAEVAEESQHVWSHKARIVLFLSAMRHFRDLLEGQGISVHYRHLDDAENRGDLPSELEAAVRELKPEKLIMAEPGDYRVSQALKAVAHRLKIELEVRTDRHFISTIQQFREHAEGRKQLRLEFFYRELRKETGVLMEDGQPVGGSWNYDAENRKSFPKSGPGLIPEPIRFEPDKTTKAVIKLVEKRFGDHPGSLANFDWPVTSDQAEKSVADFIANRLSHFGDYQDAIWTNQPFLYHSRISAALNLHLLDPRYVIRAAEKAYHDGSAPLAAVEGFVRQILGWREYVRGIYWLYMPEYLERNALKADRNLPRFYWTGETDMNCLRHSIGQTLDYGYAHHIQRLMITGLFALLLAVNPKQVHEWYLAVYVDAVEWVELPNVLGMSQYADGGTMASKPYAATGKYIDRMSNYCKGCKYNPGEKLGESACPFTTLYWDFLLRHEKSLSQNQRMSMQLRNLQRLSREDQQAVRKQSDKIALTLCE